MDKIVLNNLIDKYLSISINSTMDDYFQMKNYYNNFKNSLSDTWKRKRIKVLESIKNTHPFRQNEIPNDGFFTILYKSYHFCNILCMLKPDHNKNICDIPLQVESRMCDLIGLQKGKEVLDEQLKVIKKEYCVIKNKKVKKNDI